MIQQLFAMIRKERQLLLRDIHGLTLLFVMPLLFIVIMSLAMKADFDRRAGVQLDVLVDDQSGVGANNPVLANLAGNGQFLLHPIKDLPVTTTAKTEILADRYSFLLTLTPGSEEEPTQAQVLVAPSVSRELAQLYVATVKEALVREQLRNLFGLTDLQLAAGDRLVAVQYTQGEQAGDMAPTAVQQNVPAWLVFAMFFIVVPLSNAFIGERQFGTLRRLETLALPRWILLAGKVVPYFIINQCQVILMLLAGFFIVPWLGGDRLNLPASLPGLLLIASATSIAALGYAMVIAVVCRTIEQATTLGGAGNLILGAVGGIMVPTFVMPEFMQKLAIISPMSWGLQGFLDIFLRGGSACDVLPEALSLSVLGILALLMALILLKRQRT